MDDDELYAVAKEHQAPYELVEFCAAHGRLPVVMFTAGGIATPADAALMMQLGADGLFVGSGIFKSSDPAAMASAIVRATTQFADASIVAEVSFGLGDAMHGHRDLRARRAGPAADAWLVGSASSPCRGRSASTSPRSARSVWRRSRCGWPGDMEGLDGLVIPGGESSTMSKLIETFDARGADPRAARRRRRAPRHVRGHDRAGRARRSTAAPTSAT